MLSITLTDAVFTQLRADITSRIAEYERDMDTAKRQAAHVRRVDPQDAADLEERASILREQAAALKNVVDVLYHREFTFGAFSRAILDVAAVYGQHEARTVYVQSYMCKFFCEEFEERFTTFSQRIRSMFEQAAVMFNQLNEASNSIAAIPEFQREVAVILNECQRPLIKETMQFITMQEKLLEQYVPTEKQQ